MVYKMGPLAYQGLKRRILLLGVFAAFFAIVVAFSVSLGLVGAYLRGGEDAVLPVQLFSTLVFVVLVGGLFAFLLRRQYNNQKKLLESVEVEVGDDYIGRQQLRVPQVRLQRQEIVYAENLGNVLGLFTNDKLRTLAIPKTIDGYEKIRDTLQSWNIPLKPMTAQTKVRTLVILIGSMVGAGILFFVTNFWLVMVAWIAMVALYGYFYWLLRSSQGVDPKYLRNNLFVFLFIIFIGIVRLIALYSNTIVPRP